MPALVRVVLVVVGILAVVVGVIYLVEPVHSLPSFFPGHAAAGTGTITSAGTLRSPWAPSWCSLPRLPGALAAASTDSGPCFRAVQPMSWPFTVSVTSMLPLVALEYGHT